LRHPADVGDLASLRSLRDACLAAFGHVDVVVVAAGITKRVATLDMAKPTEPDSRHEPDRHVPDYQVFAPAMIARGAGRLIGVASLASFVGLQEVQPTREQGGGRGADAGARRRVVAPGLTVNAIAPGVFETDLNREILRARAAGNS